MATPQSDYSTTTIEERYGSDWSQYMPQDPETKRFSLLGLITGLILGTLFGWFVLGWLLFPVQYEDGYPTQLTLDSRSDYVSSVADAYAARQDELALDLARYRLRSFISEEELTQVLDETAQYFAQNYGVNDPAIYPLPVDFNSRARIANLEILANDLGVALATTVTTGAAAAESGQETTVTSVTTGEQVVVVETDDSDNSGRWLRWLLALLAAAALIGFAIYLLRMVFGRNDDEVEADVQVSQESSGYIPPASQVATQPIVPPTGGQRGTEENEHSYRAAYRDEWTEDAASGQRGYTDVADDDVDDFDDDFDDHYDDGFVEGEFRPVDHRSNDIDQGAEAPRVLYAAVDAQEHADYIFDPEDGFDADDTPGADIHVDVTVTTTTESKSTTDAMAVPSPPAATGAGKGTNRPRSVSGTLLAKETLRYHMATGGSDYDESFTLRNDQGNTIGSFGLGVNLGNGTVKSNPDQVIALDAWLFDKVDNRQPSDHRRILISEYVVDHEIEDQYGKDPTVVGRPIVAQTSTRFSIDSGRLLLHCEIVDATYDKQGIFVNVEMNMQVLLKD